MTENNGVALTSIEHPLDIEHVNAVAKVIAAAMFPHSPTAWTFCIKAAEAAIRADMAWQTAHPLPDIDPDAIETVEIEMPTVDIVFDGPPGPVAGRFVEVEDSKGRSIRFGDWFRRPDGYWVLRMPVLRSASGGILNNAF